MWALPEEHFGSLSKVIKKINAYDRSTENF
jgi:hypothetical protein